MPPLPSCIGRQSAERTEPVTKEFIKSQVAELVAHFGTRDPEEIAAGLDVCVKRSDIGSLKGMYTVLLGKPFIVISDALDEVQSRQIAAHELGHDRLHRHFAAESILQETMFYNMTSQPEAEANLFAAELLLGEGAQDLAKEGATLSEIAAAFGVEERLAEIYFENR